MQDLRLRAARLRSVEDEHAALLEVEAERALAAGADELRQLREAEDGDAVERPHHRVCEQRAVVAAHALVAEQLREEDHLSGEAERLESRAPRGWRAPEQGRGRGA